MSFFKRNHPKPLYSLHKSCGLLAPSFSALSSITTNWRLQLSSIINCTWYRHLPIWNHHFIWTPLTETRQMRMQSKSKPPWAFYITELQYSYYLLPLIISKCFLKREKESERELIFFSLQKAWESVSSLSLVEFLKLGCTA